MDIDSEEDVKKLVDRFYAKVVEDKNIGPVFTEIMKVNWEKHLPIMYSFWSSILLGKSSYSGNPMLKHIKINQHVPLLEHHFNTWLRLWKETIGENFEGEKATIAVQRAENIGRLMQFKINSTHSN